MSNIKQFLKPNDDISNYEWNMTPTPVKGHIDRLQQLLQQKQSRIDNLQTENQWLREQLDLRIERSTFVAPPLVPEIILWMMVGLFLTISGTFLEASIISLSGLWDGSSLTTQSLGVSFQIGAVLLTGCLGGKNAAICSQLIYLALGLVGLPIFDRGGGWEYVFEPHFGYLVGFVVGAWVCGYLAFQKWASIDRLMLSCCAGLLSIHAIGIVYLVALYYIRGLTAIDSLSEGIYLYSVAPLLGQLAVVCATVAIAYTIRKLMIS